MTFRLKWFVGGALLLLPSIGTAETESRVTGVLPDAALPGVTGTHQHVGSRQERGTRSRIGFLMNQPRTFGIATRVDFWRAG